MTEPIYSGPNSAALSRVPARPEPSGWPVVLVFACVALGFTAAAAEYERVAATTERNHAELLATECSVAEGKLEDLGKFLADPHTRLITLARSGSFAGNTAMVAWNSVEGHGYFFCDDLPTLDADSGYEVWALRASGEPVRIAILDAKAGASVYPLRGLQTMSGKMRLEITAGPRLPDKSPVFAGDIE